VNMNSLISPTFPRSGSKTNTKWVDLVLAEPSLDNPSRIVWIELKDMGRSAHTVIANAKGLGHDLAALWSLRPLETQQMWLDPPAHVTDRGRLQEWEKFASGLLKAQHFISQIVIVPNAANSNISVNDIEKIWIGVFEQRTQSTNADVGLDISRAETRSFTVYALIQDLPVQREKS